jgi:hypothetical protein
MPSRRQSWHSEVKSSHDKSKSPLLANNQATTAILAVNYCNQESPVTFTEILYMNCN